MKYKTKNLLKKVLTGVLALGVVAGATAGVVSLARHAKEDLREINPTFKVGGLNEVGKYVEREDTLYTKEAFECRGLEISLSFENDINYQVFFYDEVGTFLESTEVLDSKYTLGSLDVIEATHARVMIIPQWSNLEATEDKTIEEQKVINWRNKGSFVDQMTIKVAKDQKDEIVKATFTDGVSTPSDLAPYVECSERMTWEDYFEVNEKVSNDDSGYISVEDGYLTYMSYAITYNNKIVKSTDYVQNGIYINTGISVEQWLDENQ